MSNNIKIPRFFRKKITDEAKKIVEVSKGLFQVGVEIVKSALSWLGNAVGHAVGRFVPA